MSNIELATTLDLRELAEIAREAEAVLEDNENHDEDERIEALEDLNALADLADGIGLSVDRTDWSSVGDELERWGDEYEPTLIADSYFVEYCKELVKDIGYVPSDLVWFIESNIDWQGVANDLDADYSDVVLCGEVYKVRSA